MKIWEQAKCKKIRSERSISENLFDFMRGNVAVFMCVTLLNNLE